MTQSHETDQAQMSEKKLNRQGRRSRLYRTLSFGWTMIVLCVFILVGFQIGGFVWFIHQVTTPPELFEEKADGIVALTGGSGRIEMALSLLEKGTARKLLITGVHPNLSKDALIDLAKADAALFECCVDIDRKAVDTIDNANETKKWVDDNNLTSVIVVTGAFHMPRALLEFSHAMGGTKLIAYPVNVPSGKGWWRERSRLRDLVREYGKLSFVKLRDRLNKLTGREWPAMLLREQKDHS